MQASDAEELARARLAYVSAGQRPIGAPRRALREESRVDEPPAPQPVTVTAPLGPRRLTTKHLLVVAVLILCGVGIAVAALGRSAATEVPLGQPSVVSVESPSPVPSPSPTPQLRVHVAGEVESPGVVSLPPGAIVQDAVIAAGGLTPTADPAELNLAQPVTDGMQILIGSKDKPKGAVTGAAEHTSSDQDGLVNLNSATQGQLEDLPGIGPVTARAIITWREEHGSFSAVDELQEISGIGPKTFEKLRPAVTVG